MIRHLAAGDKGLLTFPGAGRIDRAGNGPFQYIDPHVLLVLDLHPATGPADAYRHIGGADIHES